MSRCPITYETCRGRYSSRGLRHLSLGLGKLEDFPFTADQQRREAAARAARMSIQGVQPKLSVRIVPSTGRLEVVDQGGRFILKPQHPLFPEVPENEDLTMRLAALAGIEVPVHGLVRCIDGSLSYLVRRFDRTGRREKLAVEDFAQLSGRTRDTKYDSSMEQLVKVVEAHCTFPVVEKTRLFSRTLFCFLTGNEDMHLKNFSLIVRGQKVELSPAYDLVNTTLVVAGTQEEVALPLKGKRRRLTRADWLDYWGRERLGLQARVLDRLVGDLAGAVPDMLALIDRSFLSADLRRRYRGLLLDRALRLGL
jgi:serine/threonine-protein kinase HipA